MRGWVGAAALFGLLVVLLAASPPPASASFPGAPGKLVFRYQGQLWWVNPDGSGLELFLDVPGGGESQPTWSGDGQKIAFEHPDDRPFPQQPDIWLADGDGSNAHHVITNGLTPSLSPDGERLTFARKGPNGYTDIWVADAD